MDGVGSSRLRGTCLCHVHGAFHGFRIRHRSFHTPQLPTTGGYAVTGQLGSIGYTSVLYDAGNGLETSDANFILGASDGYVWIGGYSGILRYDGTNFQKLDTALGLANGRALFEDSRGRVWIGTNDNGVVVLDRAESTHLTWREGLPSSSIRAFEEDSDGNIWIGTTAGLCRVTPDLWIQNLEDSGLSGERIMRLDRGADGVIYGQTRSGSIFALRNGEISQLYTSDQLGLPIITSVLADPATAGYVYVCTETDEIWYGQFGDSAAEMQRISIAPCRGFSGSPSNADGSG